MRPIALLRPVGRVSILVISVVALAGLLAAAAWWYAADRQRYAVAVPPPTAAPEQVVLAYLHALDAHDSATAEALTTTDHQSTTGMWLRTTARIAAIRITGERPGTHYGQSSQTAFKQAYEVDTHFTYASHWWDSDISFPNGSHDWTYTLVRHDNRWLIQDEGQG